MFIFFFDKISIIPVIFLLQRSVGEGENPASLVCHFLCIVIIINTVICVSVIDKRNIHHLSREISFVSIQYSTWRKKRNSKNEIFTYVLKLLFFFYENREKLQDSLIYCFRQNSNVNIRLI